MSEVFSGRCLCGAVRYECRGPVLSPCLCHCESCRRASGAHAVAWATVGRDSFRVLTGTLRSFASSPTVVRQFCELCGSPLTYWNAGWPDQIDVTIATLDQADDVPPEEHLWMEAASSWDRPVDGLPQQPRSRKE
jgi:hypothetical protein